jgi:hypothetical protein
MPFLLKALNSITVGACLPVRLNGLIRKSRPHKLDQTASVVHWRTQKQCGELRGQLDQLLREMVGLRLRPQSLPTVEPAPHRLSCGSYQESE